MHEKIQKGFKNELKLFLKIDKKWKERERERDFERRKIER